MSSLQIENMFLDLQRELRRNFQPPVYVGYSGGVDSILLLSLACQAYGADQVTAIHVNHQVSEFATQWQEHCVAQAEQLGCSCIVRTVEVGNRGQGIESDARDRRYDAFANVMPEGGTLLLGHHLDDQIETFFLRLLRGAGQHGLQGMVQESNRDGYRIIRPLLTTSRQDIELMAQHHGLRWIDDESNEDTRFDRNFLRHEVLPKIESRWPGYRQRILQTQQLIAGTETSSVDMSEALAHRLSHDQGLKMVQLDELSRDQILSLLHQWLTTVGQKVPSKARLEVVLDEVVHARQDARPSVRIGEGTIQRHGPALYWVADSPLPSQAPLVQMDEALVWPGVGSVRLKTVTEGPRLSVTLPDLSLRLRAGGEMLRPLGRSRSRDLKRLLQEYRVKPWLRDRMPLLFSGKELVAAGDELMSADHLAVGDNPGFVLDWQKSD
ncbi:tRNA lysidine(34) synthetase TilS [Reinekea blandensis]|uniref:tRNA lysidine(34) synthetase TilS n=1 Tax=Reinekea blandensis TaxID=374838 RepID=UPI0012B61C3F|nr:tRNA lysidine(34) synthetase TilS [Reinekea blandensis]